VAGVSGVAKCILGAIAAEQCNVGISGPCQLVNRSPQNSVGDLVVDEGRLQACGTWGVSVARLPPYREPRGSQARARRPVRQSFSDYACCVAANDLSLRHGGKPQIHRATFVGSTLAKRDPAQPVNRHDRGKAPNRRNIAGPQ
jgi:hypothetical protein